MSILCDSVTFVVQIS